MADKKLVSAWKGLNNVGEYTRTGIEYLAVADNVDVTDTGRIETREGFTRRITSSMTGGYSTKDHQRMYVVAGGWVCRVSPSLQLIQISQLTGTQRMHWAQVNNDVYFSNGVDYGRISEDDAFTPWALGAPNPVSLAAAPGNSTPGRYQVACTYVMADGRESGAGPAQTIALADRQAIEISGIAQKAGASTRVYVTPANSSVFGLVGVTTATSMTVNVNPDDLGESMQTQFLDDIPDGCTVIEHFRGRMYAAMYMPAANASFVMFSKPMQPHLFDMAEDFIAVPGQVHMLADAGEALLIGTSQGIHAYNEESLNELAPYGVVPGWPSTIEPDTKKVLMWTQRGICRGLPFENLTQNTVSVPHGMQAGVAVIQRDGQKRLITTLVDGGNSFNQRL